MFLSSRTLPGQRCAAQRVQRRLGGTRTAPRPRSRDEVRGRAAGCRRGARAAAAVHDRRRQPVVEVLRGTASPRPRAARSRLVAAMMRTSTRRSRVPPTRRTDRLSSARSSLRLQLERQLANLVEEQRAAVGALERAAVLGVRAGEGAALVTEQLALDRGWRGTAPQSNTTNGPPRARAGARGSRARARPCRCRSRRSASASRRWPRGASDPRARRSSPATARRPARTRGRGAVALFRTRHAGVGLEVCVAEWIGKDAFRGRPKLHSSPITVRNTATCDVCAEGSASTNPARRGTSGTAPCCGPVTRSRGRAGI